MLTKTRLWKTPSGRQRDVHDLGEVHLEDGQEEFHPADAGRQRCRSLPLAGCRRRWPYRTWGYPVTPAIFLAVSGWMLCHLLEDPSTRAPSLWGLATAALGLIIYYLLPKKAPNDTL
jgi:hypothetical protein